jgi:hypothetical protein
LPREFNPPPLVLALTSALVGIVEMLLSAGAHIECVDDNGKTACFESGFRLIWQQRSVACRWLEDCNKEQQ